MLGSGFEDWVTSKAESEEEEGDGEKGAGNSGDGPDANAVAEGGVELGSPLLRQDSESALVVNGDAGNRLQAAGAQPSSPPDTFRGKLFAMMNGQGRFGNMFTYFIFTLIILVVADSILDTVDSITRHREARRILDGFELFAVIVFVIEYVLRIYVAPEEPEYRELARRSEWLARLRYMVSFYAVIDALAIFPYFVSISPTHLPADVDNLLRMLRILRLVSLDRFLPSVTLLDDVLRSRRHALFVTGFASMVLWIIFATLLFLA